LFNSRKVPEIPENIGSASKSPGGIGAPLGMPTSTARLFVSAPVGQDTMHSPHDTHEDSPMGKLLSKAIPAWRSSTHGRIDQDE